MSEGQIHPVVLCGGAGTRLWPLSRDSYPKQFSPLLSGGTLFEQTLGRLKGADLAAPFVMTGTELRFIAGEQAAEAGVNLASIVIEPEARGTAPAVCTAALMVAARDPGGLVLVLPSDHAIENAEAFQAAVTMAAKAAREGLVCLGIRPDRAEAGHGYIELGAEEGEVPGPQPFARLVGTPGQGAEAMTASGSHLWHSGIFLCPAAALITLFETHAPEVLSACRTAMAEGQEDLDFFRLGPAYAANPDISVESGVLEKITGQVVLLDCGWEDIGAWTSVAHHMERDAADNALAGAATAVECTGSVLRAETPGQYVVGFGLTDVVAVAMRDAVLVAAKDRAQEVGRVVAALQAEEAPQATGFPRCYRPWGWYETLALGSRFQVKQIMVKPGGVLSLQSHVHRSEHWVVVAGTARVTVDEDVRLLTENQSVYIPLGAIHRLENPGKVELHLIEVQSGVYLGEDDIVRYEDIYARA